MDKTSQKHNKVYHSLINTRPFPVEVIFCIEEFWYAKEYHHHCNSYNRTSQVRLFWVAELIQPNEPNYSFGYHMGSCISSLHSMCTNNLLQGNCLRQNSMGVSSYSCRQNRCISTVHVFCSSSSCCNVHSKRLPGVGKSFFISAIFFSISLFISMHFFPTLFSITPLRFTYKQRNIHFLSSIWALARSCSYQDSVILTSAVSTYHGQNQLQIRTL